MLTSFQKHLYLENGAARFALATVASFESDGPRCGAPQPEFILNGRPTRVFADEEAVIEAARQGIRDAERELNWSGEPHSLIRLEGLLVDGIDAKAAYIAAHKAAESLIQNR